MDAAVARVREGGNGYSGDAHDVAECPGKEDLAEEIKGPVVSENEQDGGSEHKGISEVCEPEHMYGWYGLEETVGQLGCCSVVG